MLLWPFINQHLTKSALSDCLLAWGTAQTSDNDGLSWIVLKEALLLMIWIKGRGKLWVVKIVEWLFFEGPVKCNFQVKALNHPCVLPHLLSYSYILMETLLSCDILLAAGVVKEINTTPFWTSGNWRCGDEVRAAGNRWGVERGISVVGVRCWCGRGSVLSEFTWVFQSLLWKQDSPVDAGASGHRSWGWLITQ